MKKSKFSEAQIIGILNDQSKQGQKVAEVWVLEVIQAIKSSIQLGRYLFCSPSNSHTFIRSNNIP